MPIKLAAIIPHPLPLIPNIGKENSNLLEKTKNIYQKLVERIKEEKIETIIIFSSHGPIRPNIFSINFAQEFEINFEEFGDFASRFKIEGDLELAQTIRDAFLEDDSVQAINEEKLDHGCGVPLFTLSQSLKKIKIIPIYISGANLETHFKFGQIIGEQLAKSRKKIAVLSSGDLSHCLTKASPAGYSPRAAKFDQRLVEFWQDKKIEEILKLDEKLIEETKPCGLKAIAILIGVISETLWELENHSYEAPFGVGYLTAIIKLIPPQKIISE